MDVLGAGLKVALYGKVEFDSYSGELTMMHPEYEMLSDDEDGDASLHTGRVVPIYEGAGKITTRLFRTLIHKIFQETAPIEDVLAAAYSGSLKLPDRWTALRDLHFPPPDSDLRLLNAFRSPAQYRLIFEEFFWLECGLELKRAKARTYPGIAFGLTDRVRERIKEMLPFKPTGAQKRVLGEIAKDMATAAPHVSTAAGRRGQRQDAGGGGGSDHRDRERLSGRGAGTHGNPGHAALFLLQEAVHKLGYVTILLTGSSPHAIRCS